MDHRQIEEKLQEAYDTGFQDGGKSLRQAGGGAEGTPNWRKAVESALEETKGIGPGRKALFLERLDRKTKGQQEAEELQ